MQIMQYYIYPRLLRKNSICAFSLVEVALAMAVITLSCLILLGLLGVGLQSVRQAIGSTMQAQIMQSIINSAGVQAYNGGSFTNSMGNTPAVYYFDDEGTLLSNSSNWVYSATVTTMTLSLPGSSGSASVPVARPTASLLQAVITSKNNPNMAGTNTLAWPNMGS